MNKLILIVDLEATCWANDPEQRVKSEVIEIGAVLFDPARQSAVGEFQSFVRPELHPELSEHCTRLTTIRQADVDGAPLFPEALARLELQLLGGRRVILASWGDYDRAQLRLECRRHGLGWPFVGQHVNIKKDFARWRGCRPCGLDAATAMLRLPFEGTHHRGIDDARQIARIYAAMLAP